MQLYNKNRVRTEIPLPSGLTATSDDAGYVEVADAADVTHLLSLGWAQFPPATPGTVGAPVRQPEEPDRQPLNATPGKITPGSKTF